MGPRAHRGRGGRRHAVPGRLGHERAVPPDRAIHLVIHPQLVVRRDVTGALLEVLDDDAARSRSAGADAAVESWMHLEIDRETDPSELPAIETGCAASSVTSARSSRTGRRCATQRAAAGRRARRACPTATWPRGGRRGLGAVALAGRRPLHVPRLPRVRAGRDTRTSEVLRAIPGTGLGILRSDTRHDTDRLRARLPPRRSGRRRREPQLLVLTKANSRATVHRPAYLDYVGVKTFDAAGNVIGERRFLGLFSSAAYTRACTRIPVLRRKVQRGAGRLRLHRSESHAGRDLLEILETYPRDELFQVSAEELLPTVAGSVLHLQERRQSCGCSCARTRTAASCPAWSTCRVTATPRRSGCAMEQILMAALERRRGRLHRPGVASPCWPGCTSWSGWRRARADPGASTTESSSRQKLAEAARSWADDFTDALRRPAAARRRPPSSLKPLRRGLPRGYKEDFPARTAVADLRRLRVAAAARRPRLNLYQPLGALPRRAPVQDLPGRGTGLAVRVLPVLQRMGVEVVDERPYEIEPLDGGSPGSTTSACARTASRTRPDLARGSRRPSRRPGPGAPSPTASTRWCSRAGLTWRQAMVLRAYAKYLRQAGSTFSQEYIEQCLLRQRHHHPPARPALRGPSDPAVDGRNGERAELVAALVEEIDGRARRRREPRPGPHPALVPAPDHGDPAHQLLPAAADGACQAYVSFKLDPQAIPDLPAPRPRFEIWVYSPRVEGVHLRFGAVARGGLRWSDRREDFRTEILGLVKAQMVKNTVIVPVGAKGGFVVKHASRTRRRPRGLARRGHRLLQDLHLGAAGHHRQPRRAARSSHPVDVVRHDGDDTYLVVAADKGTATFSDIANGVALAYGFWLGDAFASGGSVGYDHKAMGITARGAWESVKRHFRELGLDTQTEDFTVVGIGDMSGDVFGNGMLLSRAHPAGGGLRPPAHLPRPGPGRRRPRSPSAGGCSTCRAPPGRTTTRR